MTTTTETTDTLDTTLVRRETEPVVLTEDEKRRGSLLYLIEVVNFLRAPLSLSVRPLVRHLERDDWWKPGERERFIAWRLHSETLVADVRQCQQKVVLELDLHPSYLDV